MILEYCNGRIKILVFLVLLVCPLLAYSEQIGVTRETATSAEKTLNHYLQLRLEDADWRDYSAFITWSDEPSWDCKWVTEKYDLGQSRGTEKGRVIIPVVFKRLGLFCDDFQFSPELKEVTINYRLIMRKNVWKIDAPIPDYPDISADILRKSLAASSENLVESPERRAQFAAALRDLSVR